MVVAQWASVLTLGDVASVSPLLKTVMKGELERLAGRSVQERNGWKCSCLPKFRRAAVPFNGDYSNYN